MILRKGVKAGLDYSQVEYCLSCVDEWHCLLVFIVALRGHYLFFVGSCGAKMTWCSNTCC